MCVGGVIVDPLFHLTFFIAHASIHDLELSTAVLLALQFQPRVALAEHLKSSSSPI